MKVEFTDGYAVVRFRDVLEQRCSLQEVPNEADKRVWLGVYPHQMYIDQAMAQELIDHLQTFVVTGQLVPQKRG